jgi:nitrogen PTS system EIIA component
LKATPPPLPAASLAALLDESHVFLRVRAADKPRLLQELSRRAGAVLGLPAADIAAALSAREALGSTGVGHGIAVPHAQLPQLPATVAFFAHLDRPVDFASIDDKPVDLVFLLLGPPQARAEHLSLLAAGTRKLREKSVADGLRAAATPADARRLLVG